MINLFHTLRQNGIVTAAVGGRGCCRAALVGAGLIGVWPAERSAFCVRQDPGGIRIVNWRDGTQVFSEPAAGFGRVTGWVLLGLGNAVSCTLGIFRLVFWICLRTKECAPVPLATIEPLSSADAESRRFNFLIGLG